MKRYIWQKRLAETGCAVTNPRSQIKYSCLLFAKAKHKITDNSIYQVWIVLLIFMRIPISNKDKKTS